MAIFGNTSSQQHSILAGYQRRANQLKARSTSRYNVGTNLGSVANRINDGYNKRFTKPYGEPEVLQQKVNQWGTHTEDNVRKATNTLSTLRKQKAEAQEKLAVMDEFHPTAKKQLQLVSSDEETEVRQFDSNALAEAQNKIKAIPEFKSYNVFNGDTLRRKMARSIRFVKPNKDGKDWGILAQPNDSYLDPNSFDGKIVLAEDALRKVHDVTDRVYMKDIEDFMVDGRLMRESKTAIMVAPTTAILTALGIGVLYYGFFQPKASIGFKGGNKSAATAVFG